MRAETEGITDSVAYDAALFNLLVLFPYAGHTFFELIFCELVLDVVYVNM